MSAADPRARGAVQGGDRPGTPAAGRIVDRERVLALSHRLAFTINLAWSVAVPVIPLFAISRGASPAAVGGVVSASAVLPLLFGLHGGALVDVHGPAAVMRWSAVLYGAAFVLLLALPSLTAVAVAYALMGLGITGLIVGPQALVAAWSTSAERPHLIGHYSFWVSLGMVSGPLIGGMLVDLLGYGAAFALSAACTLPILVLVQRLPSGPATRQAPRLTVLRVHTLVGPLARRPGIAGVLLISFVAIFAYTLKQSFYPIYLKEVGFSTTVIGTILALHSAASMVVRPLIGVGIQRLGYPALLVGGILFAAAGLGVVPLFHTFLPLALAAALVGVAQGLTQPLTISLLTDAVDEHMRGVALGLRLSIMRLATVTSPLAFGVAVTVWGLSSVFYLAALVLGGVALGLLRFVRTVALS